MVKSINKLPSDEEDLDISKNIIEQLNPKYAINL
jgi:hypothetical protein